MNWQLRDRETGETHDLGPIPENPSERRRAVTGMVYKIDFQRFELLEVADQPTAY